MKKNGKDIMRMAESFNPGLPIYSEKEYRIRNGELSIKLYGQEHFPITSFTWIDRGREFTIMNTQLYIFMSSILTYTYRKI